MKRIFRFRQRQRGTKSKRRAQKGRRSVRSGPSRIVGRPNHSYRPYEISLPVSLRGVKTRPRSLPGSGRRASTLPWHWVSGLLLVVSIWAVYWFANSSSFYIGQVEVEGNGRLSEAEILTLSQLSGMNVFWADTAQAVQRIEALPDVESAGVRCRLPAHCVIHVVERKPVLVWRQGEAHIWIGADGVAVAARGRLPNTTVLEAVGTTALKPGDRLDPKIIQAIQAMQALRPEVQVYQYSDHYGLMFSPSPNQTVRLGDGDRIAAKLAIMDALTKKLLDQGVRPSLIDVRYPEAPYYIVSPDESASGSPRLGSSAGERLDFWHLQTKGRQKQLWNARS